MFTLLKVVRMAVFVLRLQQQALSDAGAQTRHRHPLFRTVTGHDHRRRSRCGLPGSDRIAFGDTTTPAGTGDVIGGDAFFVEDLACGGWLNPAALSAAGGG